MASKDGPFSVFAEPSTTGERAARRILLETARETTELQRHYDTALLSQNPRHKRQANLSRCNLEHAVNSLRTITDVPDVMISRITAAVSAANDVLARILPFDEGTAVELTVPLANWTSTHTAFRPIESSQNPPVSTTTDGVNPPPSPHSEGGLRSLFDDSPLPASPVLRSVGRENAAIHGDAFSLSSSPALGEENERPTSSLSSSSRHRDTALAVGSARRERLSARQELRRKIEKRRDELERLTLDLECAENLERAERADEQLEIDNEVAVTLGDPLENWVSDTCARTQPIPRTQSVPYTRPSPCTQPIPCTQPVSYTRPSPCMQPIPRTQANLGLSTATPVITTQVHVTPTPCIQTTTYTRPFSQTFVPTYSAPPVYMQAPTYAHTQMHAPPQSVPDIPPYSSQPMSAPFFPWHTPPPVAPHPPTPITAVGGGQPGLLQGDVARSLLTVNLMSHARDMIVQSRPPAQKRFSGGTAQDFETFMTQFEKAMKVDGVTDQMRFCELKYWVTGSASLVVTQYENEQDSTEALKRAKDHLRREFGRKLFTARQMLDELLSGPKLNENDNEAVQAFLLKLSQVHKRAIETKREATFSTRETFDDIIRKKLPSYARKWATKYTDSEERIADNPSRAEELTFSTFLDFCRRMNKINANRKAIFKADAATTQSASKANSQSNGNTAAGNRRPKIAATDVSTESDVNASVAATTTSKPRNKKPQVPMKKGTAPPAKTYAAAATRTASGGDSQKGKPTPASSKDTSPKSTGEKPCLACESGRHDLDACREFMKKDDEDRRLFVRQKGICYRCLKHGHLAANCPVDVRCKECNGKHNSVFHRALPDKKQKSDDQTEC